MKITPILFLCASMLCSCSNLAHSVTELDNSVVIMGDSLTTTIEIVDESIIHVVKRPNNQTGYQVPNLVSVIEPQGVKYRVKSTLSGIKITTDKLRVYIDEDGTIEYKDKRGKHLVSESREVSYINEEDNTAAQSFTVGDEALYGLGQFQSGIFDWRGVPMTLRQFNQEVAVPFLISTNNYGILWNNYSVTDFNPAENEIVFSEEDAQLTQIDYDTKDIDVENVANSKTSLDKESNIRYTTFTPEQSGVYKFYVEVDKSVKMRGCIKVTFDDQVVADYSTVWVATSLSGTTYLEAGHEYKVMFQNSGSQVPGRLFYNTPDYNKTLFSSRAARSIDYYLIAGDTPSEIIALNHKLTGKAPMLRRGAYGFWQCRERYHNQDELLDNAREMRKRKIPFDVIVQDWFYWPVGTKGPEWDRARYYDPKAMADELEDMNLDLMVSVWPMVVNEPLLKNYGLTKSLLGDTPYVDFWDKKAGDKFYTMLRDSMFDFGVDYIWLDGTEPEQKAADNFMTPQGEFKYLTNAYSLVVNKSVYENKRKDYPLERVSNLSRSAFTGQQRYGGITWSGDVQGTWKQFGEQIVAGMNFTMAGLPYWSHDIGGFFRDSKSQNPLYDNQYTNPEYIELLTRWFQFGAFSPIFRIHGFVSETEIWRYNDEFEQMARNFIDLRYQLMPYIYSTAWQTTQRGQLLMAPLVYTYPDDKEVWNIKDQTLFGESIMAAFVTEYGAREKAVYLPKGKWYDFWSNELIEGGEKIVAQAPLERLPLYVKAGSIIPFGPKVQYATEPTTEPMHIRVYGGEDAHFTLYLDDNTTTEYMNGAYSEINFDYDESSRELTITKGDGDYIDFSGEPMPFKIDVMDSNVSHEVNFAGAELSIRM